jgi:glycosyltransferase involved in cell wall biosynthesis
MTNIPDFSIVVPVFNSELALLKLNEELQKIPLVLDLKIEIIYVDDSSKDNSLLLIQDLSKRFSNIKSLRNLTNQGQIKTTNKGIEHTLGNFIVTIDDDLEYPPSEIIKLYKTITEKGADIVFGISKDKYDLQDKNVWFANLRNKILNKIWNKPKTESFKIFRRSVVFDESRFLITSNFEAFIAKRNFKIEYVNTDFNKRMFGRSNYNWIRKIKFIIEMNAGFLKN